MNNYFVWRNVAVEVAVVDRKVPNILSRSPDIQVFDTCKLDTVYGNTIWIDDFVHRRTTLKETTDNWLYVRIAYLIPILWLIKRLRGNYIDCFEVNLEWQDKTRQDDNILFVLIFKYSNYIWINEIRNVSTSYLK